MSVQYPTTEQINKIDELKAQGFTWDQDKSISAAGVIMTKGDKEWFFGLQGEIMENPNLPEPWHEPKDPEVSYE